VTYTVLLGLASAFCWGAPDLWLAQASRRLGPFRVVFGSILVGVVAVSPIALFVDWPSWTAQSLALAIALGPFSVIAYMAGFSAFKTGAVSVVAPIVACEGGLAALFAIAGGERPSGLLLVFLPVAMIGVVFAAMGRGGGRAAVVPAVVCAVMWGAILALSVPVADDVGAFWAFFVTRLSALVSILPFALRGGAASGWLQDRWRVTAWGLGDSFAYLLFVVAAARGPASVASVLVAQFATVAVVVGMVFGGERLLRRQLVGVLVVIVAVTGMAAAGGE
jgi:drug/metabolite transporter (DMT)-like permease